MSYPILILGGTTEAYELADRLVAAGQLRVISSLAGRTESPRLPAGEVRIGGFGGVEGLAEFLRIQAIRCVIDATHPFAAQMGWHAWEACTLCDVPLLRLERPPWTPASGDRWEEVASWSEAVERLQRLNAKRIFLAIGRQELQHFAGLDDRWFLIRLVSPPDPLPPFCRAEWLYARGPFDLAAERAMLDRYRIEAIVCKNSGSEATAAKLIAARERAIPVVMRKRPPRSPEVQSVATVEAVLDWLSRVSKM
ncbi:cobalt-precorrin-6A reductase [Caldichromatium japonicum]|uniref:Cobalt-precorrin-6A reductase n=1 Tax=Caldichromatium japonicum TaxID=2699430 RepID=A0A6G7VCA2_9GAMM|nr:cobalt-precorrin-6A reductase [Caldichromatium japonicum]QIK37594.1 cobalt-precorrin-6A reductase [Caldichromatium japonicum]